MFDVFLFKFIQYIYSSQLHSNWNRSPNPASIYLLKVHSRNTRKLKVHNRNTRKRCEICSKLTIMTPEQRHWRCSGVFIVNFKYISHLVLVFPLLTLNMRLPTGKWGKRWSLGLNSTYFEVVRNHISLHKTF